MTSMPSLTAVFLVLTATCGLCGEPTLGRFEFSQAHMGTLFRIVLYALDAAAATRASNAAFERIKELDHIMSDYDPGSELMELCRRAGGPPVKVSEDLFRVLARSREVAQESHGAFDITVGPIVRLWRRVHRQHELPDSASLLHALELVGYKYLNLDRTARTAQLLKPGMLLDLGGIAKGDSSDQALLVLKRFGIERALVAGGGDIAVSGPPPGERGWLIVIAPLAAPSNNANEPAIANRQSKIENPQARPRTIFLHDAGVSTSGDTEQHVEISGVQYSHIVNPKNGMALTGRSSVTVIARNDITADALATAVSVLGPERGLKLIESIPSTAVLFVVMTDRGPKTFEVRFPKE